MIFNSLKLWNVLFLSQNWSLNDHLEENKVNWDIFSVSLLEKVSSFSRRLSVSKIQMFGSDLEVWAGDTSGDLFEERLLDLDELCWFDDVQDLLQLP